MLRVVIDTQGAGTRLTTDSPIRRGDVVSPIAGYRTVDRPGRYTLQIGIDRHIDELGPLTYLNHSCQPNTLIDATAMAIYAARDLAAGEELTFFYPSTEWEMGSPFVCLCGAPGCLGLVGGAKFLSLEVLSRYFINRHIRDLAVAALDRAAQIRGVM
jgi:hypothetical protein